MHRDDTVSKRERRGLVLLENTIEITVVVTTLIRFIPHLSCSCCMHIYINKKHFCHYLHLPFTVFLIRTE